MKSLIQHIASYGLAAHLLLLSIGLPIHKRTCQMPEMADVYQLFSPPTTCCGKEAPPDFSHACAPEKAPFTPLEPCCDFSLTYWQIDLETSLPGDLQMETSAWMLALPQAFLLPPLGTSFVPEALIFSLAEDPPPLSGRDLLCYGQNFLL
ncbi:MAG: hypothetical protein HC913_13820 [Microscillaceae bacterium]|nr:hypothetical protein [Microscillaceae bacterium]